jgi:alanine racemase
MENQNCTNWLEIDLGVIRANIKNLMEITQRPIMPVVKANAYGLGALEVAKAAGQAGASWFGVARLEEALKLRQGGINHPILVLGYTPPVCIPEAVRNDIRVTVYNLDTASAYHAIAKKTGTKLKIHVKVDSGMGRLGIFPEDGVEFLQDLLTLDGIFVEGMFTHFARADDPQLPTTDGQIDRFGALVAEIQAAGLKPPLVHAANSAGSIHFARSYFDLVRAGAAIVGINPNPPESMLPGGFQPAFSWKTRLISVKMMPSGSGIGYGHRYITSKTERIGVISIGYGDGYRRIPGNTVIVHGKMVPVVGGVCMDQCMVQLDGVPEAQIGDEVLLLGTQGMCSITAEDLATLWKTINYDVITSLAERITRIYLD